MSLEEKENLTRVYFETETLNTKVLILSKI